jgi:hypothetical protein
LIQSLLLTAVGGILGISGTLIATRWQAREARQERIERYDREDRYRLTKDRIEAYSSFFIAAGEVRSLMWGKVVGDGGVPPSEAMSVRNKLWQAFTYIALIGDPETRRRSAALVDYATSVARREKHFDSNEWGDRVDNFIAAAHAEFVPSRLSDT